MTRGSLVLTLVGLAFLGSRPALAQDPVTEETNAMTALMQMVAAADPKVVDERFTIPAGQTQQITFGGIGGSLKVSVKVRLTWQTLPIGMPAPIEAKFFDGRGRLLVSKTSGTSPLTTTSTILTSASGHPRLVIKNTSPGVTAVSMRVDLVGAVVN